jgi:AcrR family transcriptional regulator
MNCENKLETLDRVSKKDIIKEAAKSLFIKNGYVGTSTRDICRVADVNISMISYYFGSKEGLFNEIVEDYKNVVTAAFSKFVDFDVDLKILSDEEKVQILCEFLDVATDYFYKYITKEMIDFVLSVRNIIDFKILPAPFEFVRSVVASIMKRNRDDKEVTFKSFSIISPIMFPRVMTHISFPALMQNDFSEIDVQYIKKIVRQNVINLAAEQGV